uniref:Uncharacterized protein n=1 Tax=Arion vulgaris TaxID=1028688 RepID=A0A0B7BHB3_9EUPU
MIDLRCQPSSEIMPGLCLNNVGQDSTLGDSNVYNRNSWNKPIFHSFRTSQFLTKSNMASVTSLAHNSSYSHYMPAKPFTKSHSLSEVAKPKMNNNLWTRKSISTSFDVPRIILTPVNKFPLCTPFMPAGSYFDWSSTHVDKIVDAPMSPPLETLVPRDKMVPPVNISCSISSPVAADVRTVSLQPNHSPDSTVCCKSLQCSVWEDVNIPYLAINSSYKLPVSEAIMKNNSKKVVPVKSSSLGESNVASDYSDVTGGSKESKKKCPLDYEYSSFYDSQLNENGTRSCDIQNENREFGSISDNNTSQCSSKSINNLASILSAPRRTVKKGRPSSKKQKKRQREKRKQRSSPLLMDKQSMSSQTKDEIKQSHVDPTSLAFASDLTEKIDGILNSSLTSTAEFQKTKTKEFTSEKTSSKLCKITRMFFRLKSSSEEIDEIDGSSEWSVNKGVCISPINGYGFNFASNLDSIFKKKSIPSLKKVVHPEVNGTNLSSSVEYVENSVCESLSEDDGLEDSAEVSVTPASSEYITFDFSPCLSLDTLFPKKQNSKNQTAANRTEVAVPLVDDLPSADDSNLLVNGQDTDYETLNRINAQWNDNYPTAGFRSCSTISGDFIEDPSIKVHFASEPYLLTVHIVGTEERGGISHYALDRERFERRILESEQIISPVLDADHRAKILEYRRCHEEQ